MTKHILDKIQSNKMRRRRNVNATKYKSTKIQIKQKKGKKTNATNVKKKKNYKSYKIQTYEIKMR